MKFEEEQVAFATIDTDSALTRWLIMHSGGLIKNKEQSRILKIIVIIIAIIGIIVLQRDAKDSRPTSGAVPPGQTVAQ